MRGGFSYVVMLVINPILILFYQNCSVVPASSTRAMAQKDPPAQQQCQAKHCDKARSLVH